MQSKEVMKKLADNYETLVFVSKRYPSSMSRLKNLLMSEGVSETSARRIIADLETEAGCCKRYNKTSRFRQLKTSTF